MPISVNKYTKLKRTLKCWKNLTFNEKLKSTKPVARTFMMKNVNIKRLLVLLLTLSRFSIVFIKTNSMWVHFAKSARTIYWYPHFGRLFKTVAPH